MVGSNTVPGPCKYFNYYECHRAVLLWQVFSPIFIVVGVFGNLLSLAVLSRRRMNNTTTSVYLRYLAIIDSLVLLIGNLREFIQYATNIDIRELNDAMCRIHFWISLNVTALSGWLLSILTIDRLISVKAPFWARSKCSKTSAVVISAAATGCMFLINSHILGYLKRTEIRVHSAALNNTIVLDVQCLPSEPIYMRFWSKVWPITVFALYSFLPLICLITSNVLLINELTKRNDPLRLSNGVTLSSSQRKDFRSLTRMLIAVCIFFAAISLPTSIYLIMESYIFSGTSPRDISKRRLAWAIVSILMYSNNAVNFFLYCLSGSLFRRELKALMSEIKTSVRQHLNRRIAPTNDQEPMRSVNSVGQDNNTENNQIFVTTTKNYTSASCNVRCHSTNITTVST